MDQRIRHYYVLILRQHVWVDKNAFSTICLHIGFNDNLTNEERTWFNELLVTTLYYEHAKIIEFAGILYNWTRANNVDKVAKVNELFYNRWELKEAFNYMLPEDSPPELYIPLPEIEQRQALVAFNNANPIYANYRQKYGSNNKKIFRKILTSVVERRAIAIGSYHYVLYALYVFRSRGTTYPDISFEVSSLKLVNRIRHYFSRILDTDGQGWYSTLQERVNTQIYFFHDFRTYVHQLSCQYSERDRPFCEWACLVRALKTNQSYHGRRPNEDNDEGRGILLLQGPHDKRPQHPETPFQNLLGNICLSLSPHCTTLLLDFKKHLLYIPFLTHVVINIGLDPMFDAAYF